MRPKIEIDGEKRILAWAVPEKQAHGVEGNYLKTH